MGRFISIVLVFGSRKVRAVFLNFRFMGIF